MKAPLLLTVFSLLCLGAPAQQSKPKENPAPRIKAAGTDVGKLLALAKGWAEAKQADAARAAYRRVIELEPDNADARAGLNHQFYDGRWFESFTALFDYKRAEDERMAKKGLGRLGDTWVPIADAPFLRLGWQKDEDGTWVHPLRRLRREVEKQMVAKGCQQQDLEWIPPEEFDEWRKGLWKCGEQWLDTAAADAWHADPAHPWSVMGEHFVVHATVDRERVEWCKWYADQTYPDLVRLFGVVPGERPSAVDLLGPASDKPELIVWNSLQQYNTFANGGAETDGFSSLHYAFFADALVDNDVKPAAFAGIGVAFWDSGTEALAAFGQHAIRHAAGLSFVEAIDPSWTALGDMAQGKQARSTVAFWAEKRIPRWLRYGAASYVERYFLDANAGENGDPRWARKWALSTLRQAGGLRDMQKVFEFRLALADMPGSSQLIHEAGLLVAFVLDGGDAKVQQAHQALQAALREGGATTKAVEDLEKALLAAKAAVKKFAEQ